MNKKYIKVLAIVIIVAGVGASFLNLESKNYTQVLYFGALTMFGFYLLLKKSKQEK